MSTIKSSSENLTLNADGSNNDIIFQSNGSTKVTLDGQNGRVGIGTVIPLSGLHLENTSSNDGIRIINSTSGEGYIVFGDDADNNTGSIAYDHASDAMTFDVNNSERLRILSGGGLTFNGDTSSSNALNDYEEGTWTPANNGTAFSVSYGTYTKIGNRVFCQFRVIAGGDWTSGDWSGLPFTINSATDIGRGGGSVSYNNEDTSTSWLVSCENVNTTLWSLRAGSSQKQLSSSKQCWGAFTYLV